MATDFKSKRIQERAKPYDRPKKNLLGRVGETILDIFTPSFLKINTSKSLDQQLHSASNEVNDDAPGEIEVEMDGYVATFDSSIIGEGGKSSSLAVPAPMVTPMFSSNGTVASRLTPNQSVYRTTNVNAPTPLRTESGSLGFVPCASTLFVNEKTHNQHQEQTGVFSKKTVDDLSDGQPVSKRFCPDKSSEALKVSSPIRHAAVSMSADTWTGSASRPKRSTLWTSASVMASSRTTPQIRPAFNATTFCTTNDQSRDDITSLSRGYESPFYNGRTTYGGASAYKRQPISNTSSPFQVEIVPGADNLDSGFHPFMMVTPLAYQGIKMIPSSGLERSTMSTTARRIFEALQRNSPPESYSNNTESVLSFSATSRQRNIPHPYYAGTTSDKKGPPVKDIPTPTANLISQSRSVFAPLSKPDTPQVAESLTRTSAGGGGKMKRDHSKHYSSNPAKDDNVNLDYELPTGISLLPLTTSPSFSIPLPVTKAFSSASDKPKTNSSPVKSTVSVANLPVLSTASSLPFKFSIPLKPQNRSSSGVLPAPSADDTKFSFSQPRPSSLRSTSLGGSVSASSSDTMVCQSSSSTALSVSSTPSIMQTSSGKLADFKFDTNTAVKKKPTENAQFATASSLKQGSVLDALGSKPALKPAESLAKESNKSLSEMPSSSLASNTPQELVPLSEWHKQMKAPGSWTCSECFVSNKGSDTVCVACCSTASAGVSGLPSVSSGSFPTNAFKFGNSQDVSSSITSSASTGGFKFGSTLATSSTVTSSSQTTGFKFGSTLATSSSVTSSTVAGGFNFVSNTLAVSSSISTSSIGSGFKFTPSFAATSSSDINGTSSSAFGSSSEGKVAPPPKQAPAGGFSFGVAPVSSSATVGFGGFGGIQSVTTEIEVATTAASKSSFSSSVAQTTTTSSSLSSGVFSFGSSSPAQTKVSSGGFSFGAGGSSEAKVSGLAQSSVVSSSPMLTKSALSVPETSSHTPSLFQSVGNSNTSVGISVQTSAVSSTSTAPSTGSLFAGRDIDHSKPLVVSSPGTVTPPSYGSVFGSHQSSVAAVTTTAAAPSSLFMFGGAPPAASTATFQFGSSAPPQVTSQGGFGAAPTSSLFTAPASSASVFGSVVPASVSSFGAGFKSTASFGAFPGTPISATTSVGSFSTAQSTIQGSGANSTSLVTTTPFAFGASTPAFTAVASSAAVTSAQQLFGTTSASSLPFGTKSSLPNTAFGKFEATPMTTTQAPASTPAFGTTVPPTFNFAGPTNSLFTFGATTSAATPSSSTSNFAFGKPDVSVTQPPAFGQAAAGAFGSSVPSFGQSSTASAFPQAIDSGSNVGVVSPFAQPSVFGSSSSASQPAAGFGFGQSAVPPQQFGQSTFSASQPFGSAAQNVFGQSDKPNVFSFGATANAPPSLTPGSFGASSSSATTGFTLGKRSGASSGIEDPNAKKPTGFGGFNAGQNNLFGGTSANVPAFGAPSSGFGQQQQPSVAWNTQPSNATPASFSVPASFNFAHQQPVQQTPQQQPLFQFGAPPSDPSATSHPTRIIKKAARKLRK